MRIRYFNRLCIFVLVAFMAATASKAVADQPPQLELATQPLFDPGVKPNVLLILDDSGSMDFEVLFPATGGSLYWPPNVGSLIDPDPTWQDGHFKEDVGPANAYSYLFPNGINQWTNEQAAIDGSASSRHDQRNYRLYKAIPPTPEFAFTRSPDFNRLYFNPFVDYKPWPEVKDDDQNQHMAQAAPDDAYYDPAFQEGTIDLTSIRAEQGAGELFTFSEYMNMPSDREFINCTLDDNVVGLLHADPLETVPVLDFKDVDGDGLYDPPPHDDVEPPGWVWDPLGWIDDMVDAQDGLDLEDDDLNDACASVNDARAGIESIFKEGVPDWSKTGWRTGFADLGIFDFAKIGTFAVKYHPATFYLSLNEHQGSTCSGILPDGYASAVTSLGTIGNDPTDGSDQGVLCGYRITDENSDAMQNFANWFTYYRRRHLAMRGAVLQAFHDMHGVRVGVTTINQAASESSKDSYDFKMYSLDEPSERGNLYQAIKNLDFSNRNGTPSRKALRYVGELLEHNNANDIIKHACQPNYAFLVTTAFNKSVATKVNDVDGDGVPDTMADVAMKYYEGIDLKNPNEFPLDPDVPVPAACNSGSPPERLDCKTELHMSTYAISFGQKGHYFGHKNDGFTATNPPDWPNPNPPDDTDSPDTFLEYLDWLGAQIEDTFNPLDNPEFFAKAQIDDLWHATINSYGEMFLAKSPRQITKQLTSVLSDILSSSGSASALATGGGRIYQASFTAYNWQGDLTAYALNKNGRSVLWKASQNVPDPDDRVIIVGPNADCGSPSVFKLDEVKECWPDSEKGKGQNKNEEDKLVSYLRGDDSNEFVNGGKLRNRYGNVLGDIVHSDPLYVAAPKRWRYPKNWDDARTEGNDETTDEDSSDTSYREFARSNSERTPMVYVGANDGMLHGFNAKTGEEVFAYIPGVFMSDSNDENNMIELEELTKPAYVHQPYVDGSPAVGDVFFNEAWHSVLVGGLRRGGKAVYALDVTQPSSFSANDVLWEVTNADLEQASVKQVGGELDLGYTYGQPQIIRLRNGQWAAVFNNGYNSGTGAGLVIREFGTGQIITLRPSTQNQNEPNGLAQVTPVDVDGDFIVDYIYAGDLQGNLWKFDLTSEDHMRWSVSKLFKAKDSDDDLQPITSAPVVAAHPYGRNYGLMVYFGTGSYLEDNNNPDGLVHSFYGVWDPAVIESRYHSKSITSNTNLPITRTLLQQQQLEGTENTVRKPTDDKVNYALTSSGGHGWFIDLDSDKGEQVINKPYIRHGVVGFTTALPQGTDICSAGGSGYIMRVSPLNGGPAKLEDGGQSVIPVENGRPSEASFVPETDQALYNTTRSKTEDLPTLERDFRRTWRILRPT